MDKTKELEALQIKFNALCDEQEKLPRKGFAKVFEVLDSMEETFTPQCPYTENEDTINKALEITGHSSDEAFCKAFKRNNQIMIEGKQIQYEIALLLAAMTCEKDKEEEREKADGWRFYPIHIVAPQQIQDEIITPMMQADAKEGKGLFANSTDFELEDEEEDAFLMVNVYHCEASLTRYWNELKQFGVICKGKGNAFFNYDFKMCLLKVLNKLATFTSQNTDKPAQIKNHIGETVKVFDNMPIWGLFFQILILQGLCRWLESVNINKGDDGYDEAQSLNNWICEQLKEKEKRLCYMPFGDGDKERLKPLCDYLYSTEIGKLVQANLFGGDEGNEPQQENETEKPADAKPHYSNSDRDAAKSQYDNLIKGGYMPSETPLSDWLYIYGADNTKPNSEPLKWLKTQSELSCLVQCIWGDTDPTRMWEICKNVFILTDGKRPNPDAMATLCSKINTSTKDKPKNHCKLEKLLKI